MVSYILPFHSDGRRLERTLKSLRNAAQHLPIKQVILAHNGPTMTEEEFEALKKYFWPGVEYVHTPHRGVGAGCKVAIPAVKEPYLLITGSDLPFDFSDYEGFIQTLKTSPNQKVMIGSKGHPRSQITGNSFLRKIMSTFFWLFRKIFLNIRSPRDTQGSIFLETNLAKKLCQFCYIDNYLFTMEIISRAQRAGEKVIEVPVICDMRGGGSSSVSVVKDSLKSLLEILKFSIKLRFAGNEKEQLNGKHHSPDFNH